MLSGVWNAIRANTGSLDATQALFGSWLNIAEAEYGAPSACSSTFYQAAGPDTLLEVLAADDDDGNLYNGTPNDSEICAAFASRGIYPSVDPSCPESAGSGLPGGTHPTIQALEFVNMLVAGDRRADLNRDGALDATDLAEFVGLHPFNHTGEDR